MKCTYKKVKSILGGGRIGCDDEGKLYKGIVCFMIVGLKESIPYVIKSSPETNIDASWPKTELLDSLKIFSSCGFRVRAIACDNHPSNVSSFKKLLQHVNQYPDDLCMLAFNKKPPEQSIEM